MLIAISNKIFLDRRLPVLDVQYRINLGLLVHTSLRNFMAGSLGGTSIFFSTDLDYVRYRSFGVDVGQETIPPILL